MHAGPENWEAVESQRKCGWGQKGSPSEDWLALASGQLGTHRARETQNPKGVDEHFWKP